MLSSNSLHSAAGLTAKAGGCLWVADGGGQAVLCRCPQGRSRGRGSAWGSTRPSINAGSRSRPEAGDPCGAIPHLGNFAAALWGPSSPPAALTLRGGPTPAALRTAFLRQSPSEGATRRTAALGAQQLLEQTRSGQRTTSGGGVPPAAPALGQNPGGGGLRGLRSAPLHALLVPTPCCTCASRQ